MKSLMQPHFNRTVPCPLCNRPCTNPKLRDTLFFPEEIDPDKRVRRYQWVSTVCRTVHPPHYYFWHCPRCGYTDESSTFLSPPRTPSRFRWVLPHQGRDRTFDFLADFVFDRERDFDVALGLNYLAIHVQELLEPDSRDSGKLGRFYLRLAWAYRELDEDLSKIETPEFVQALTRFWPNAAVSEHEAIAQTIHYLETGYYHLSSYDSPLCEIDLFLLLGYLHARIGDRGPALREASRAMGRALELRTSLYQLLRFNEVDGGERFALEAKIRKAQSMIERVVDFKDSLKEASENAIPHAPPLVPSLA